MNEYKLEPEEKALFDGIAQNINLTRGNVAQRRSILVDEIQQRREAIHQIDAMMAATEGQAVGALRAVIHARKLEGDWIVDTALGVITKCVAPTQAPPIQE